MVEPRGDVRKTGSVYTPGPVAAALASMATASYASGSPRVLEPSFGDGAFVNELRRLVPSVQLTLVDIDADLVARHKASMDQHGDVVEYIAGDFISYATTLIVAGARPFDIVIGNPPFIRWRNLSIEMQETVTRLAGVVNCPLQELKNSWAAFVVAAIQLLSSTGTLAFVLPYELVTVSYGRLMLKRLAESFRRVDIYVSKSRAFPEIDQDALVIIARNGPEIEAGFFIRQVDSLEDLRGGRPVSMNVSAGRDLSLEINGFLLSDKTRALLEKLRLSCPPLGTRAGSAPGIVTAANSFFILRRDDVDRRGLRDHVIPILRKSSLVGAGPIFTAADFERLADHEPSFMLKVDDAFENLSSPVRDYLIEGEAAGLQERYKCRKRSRWYAVPVIQPQVGFVFKRSHSHPRIVINEAGVHLTDSAYGLTLKEGYTVRGLCFSFYNSMTMLFAELDGRFYGGGVLELSPTEFRGLPLVYYEPDEREFLAFSNVHASSSGDPEAVLDFGDQWLRRRLCLDAEQMELLRQAWRDLRAHRLRHSGRVGQLRDTIPASSVVAIPTPTGVLSASLPTMPTRLAFAS